MEQPIIDPAKVDAWMASMRGAFNGNLTGSLVLAGAVLAFLMVVIVLAVWDAHRAHKHGA
jgi:uncharacterized membrane protein YqjE